MTPEEHQLLSQLFDRIRTASAAPRDRDVEAFIAAAVREQPYAPYLLAQTVIVQEEALKQAGRRIEELEAEIKSKDNAASGSFLGGLGKSVFGAGSVPSVGSSPRPPEAPRPSPWGQSPGAPQAMGGQPFNNQVLNQQGRGGGFLQTAMATAAGVAGGALLAHGLQSMFSGQSHAGQDPQSLLGQNPSSAPAGSEGGMIPDIFGSEERGLNKASFDPNGDDFDLPDNEPDGGDEWV